MSNNKEDTYFFTFHNPKNEPDGNKGERSE